MTSYLSKFINIIFYLFSYLSERIAIFSYGSLVVTRQEVCTYRAFQGTLWKIAKYHIKQWRSTNEAFLDDMTTWL